MGRPPAGTLVSAALVFGAAVFLLNDWFLATSSPATWIVLDYGSRAFVLAACFYALTPQQLGLLRPSSMSGAILWAFMMVLASVLADRVFRHSLPAGGLFAYPAIGGRLLTIDTVLGIPLVALSEEVLSRGVFLAWARSRGWNAPLIVLSSSALFAAFHWSLGPASLITALLFGVLAMTSVLATRSLWPAVAAHWLADLALFSLPAWLAH